MAATVSNVALNQYGVGVSGGTTPTDLFIRDVPDWTKKLRRTDTPLQRLIGRDPAPSMPMLKAEFGWGSPDPTLDVLNEALDDNETAVDVTHGNYFPVGTIFRVEEELMLVTSVSSNTLTVVRGFAGTTAAAHNTALNMYILSTAIMENQDTPLTPVTQGEVDYNYFQIIDEGIQFSNRADITPTYESKGNNARSRYEFELRKKMEDTLPVKLERTLIDGRRALGTGTSPSAMGGLLQSSFFTTSTDLSGAPLTEYDLMENLQTVYNLVGREGGAGMGMTIVCSMFIKRVISSWYNANRRYTGSDTTANVVFEQIDSEFGPIKIVDDYQLDALGRKNYLFVANWERDFALQPYASSTGWQTGRLPENGWYKRGYIRGDWTLKSRNPDSKLRLYGFSTVAADYPALA